MRGWAQADQFGPTIPSLRAAQVYARQSARLQAPLPCGSIMSGSSPPGGAAPTNPARCADGVDLPESASWENLGRNPVSLGHINPLPRPRHPINVERAERESRARGSRVLRHRAAALGTSSTTPCGLGNQAGDLRGVAVDSSGTATGESESWGTANRSPAPSPRRGLTCACGRTYRQLHCR